MSQTAQMDPSVKVSFPFTLELRHARLDLMQLFQASEAFDLHEVRRKKKDRRIAVDVLEVTPERTHIKCTPLKPSTYRELAGSVQTVLVEAGRHIYPEAPEVERLVWEIDQHGVESDRRGHFKRVV